MYNYPHHILFKIEKILGFVLLLIGIFAVLKLTGILAPELLIPNEYLAWFTSLVCVLFGFVLVTHKQHGVY
ncbi:MAG: hypothetical protein WC916_00945 [Candidatus Woesearchaeota archaeon]